MAVSNLAAEIGRMHTTHKKLVLDELALLCASPSSNSPPSDPLLLEAYFDANRIAQKVNERAQQHSRELDAPYVDSILRDAAGRGEVDVKALVGFQKNGTPNYTFGYRTLKSEPSSH